MEVYCYDQNGFYLGSGIAQANPMAHVPGEPAFLIPAHATCIAPPQAPSGKCASWNPTGPHPDDGSWTLVDDPACLAKAAQARAQNVVIFYREAPGKDTAVILISRYGLVTSQGTLLYNGLPLTDPSNAQVAAIELGSDATGADTKNENGVVLKKVVNGGVVDRDPADVFLDDTIAQGKRVVIFYRNQGGTFDNAVLQALSYRDAAIDGIFVYQGKPLSDPVNTSVSFIQSDTITIEQAMLKNANGVSTQAVVNGALVPRDPGVIAKDFRNEPALRAQASQQMAQALKDILGIDVPDIFHFLMPAQLFFTALNLDGGQSADAVSSAKVALSNYNQASIQVSQIRATLNQQLSQLEAHV